MTTHNDNAAVPQDDSRERLFDRIDEILEATDAAATLPDQTSEDTASLDYS